MKPNKQIRIQILAGILGLLVTTEIALEVFVYQGIA